METGPRDSSRADLDRLAAEAAEIAARRADLEQEIDRLRGAEADVLDYHERRYLAEERERNERALAELPELRAHLDGLATEEQPAGEHPAVDAEPCCDAAETSSCDHDDPTGTSGAEPSNDTPPASDTSASSSAPTFGAANEDNEPDRVKTIREALALLVEPGSAVELRALDHNEDVGAGTFNDLDALAREAAKLSGRVKGVYITINPINGAVSNVVRAAKKGELAKDKNVSARRWLPLDFDPIRLGDSSTDAEHEAAIERARACRAWLLTLGVPANAILLADSGNGAHLLVRIDVPNDEDSKKLVERCLKALAAKLSDERVKVDTAVGNASRIWRLYGTKACKGARTSERPHRHAKLLDVPADVAVCPRFVLDAVAAHAAPAPGVESGEGQGAPEHWIADVLAYPENVQPGGGNQRETILKLSTYLSGIVEPDIAHGILWSCVQRFPMDAGNPWTEEHVTEFLASAYAKRAAQGHERGFATTLPPGAASGQSTVNAPALRAIPDDEFEQRQPPEYLLDGILPMGADGKVVGDSGALKSFLALDASLSIATGEKFLGQFEVRKRGPVLYVIAEGAGAFSKRIKAWKQCRGFHGRAGVYIVPAALQLLGRGSTAVQQLLAVIATLPEPPLLIVVDTQNRSMEGMDENAPAVMSAFIAAVAQLREATGAATLIVHHTGWEGKRERGHSSQRGAADTVLHMEKLKEDATSGTVPATLSCKKQKDDEPFLSMTLVARKFPVGVDQKGRPIDSLAFVEVRPDATFDTSLPEQAGAPSPAGQLTSEQRVALNFLATSAATVYCPDVVDAVKVGARVQRTRAYTVVGVIVDRGWAVTADAPKGKRQAIAITPAGRAALLGGGAAA